MPSFHSLLARHWALTALALVWITSARANPPQDCVALQARLDSQLHGAGAVTAREDTDTDLPGPDILDELLACEQHAGPQALPHSVWLESDRKAGREALRLSAADILVVPTQVQGLGLDPIERSLMNSDLSWALGYALPYFAYDAADKALTTAFRQKYFAVAGKFGARPIQIDYQYAEACEWLLQFTGDKRFEAKMLDWALKIENSAPIAAWPYGIEYQYSTDSQRKLRALAMTLYLDPRSERISSAAAADRAKARQWLDHNNPFKPGGQKKEGPKPADVQL